MEEDIGVNCDHNYDQKPKVKTTKTASTSITTSTEVTTTLKSSDEPGDIR